MRKEIIKKLKELINKESKMSDGIMYEIRKGIERGLSKSLLEKCMQIQNTMNIKCFK